MLALKGIYDGENVRLDKMPSISKPCKVIVTFLDELDQEEELIRNAYAQNGNMDFWKCEEEDLYQDYIPKSKTR